MDSLGHTDLTDVIRSEVTLATWCPSTTLDCSDAAPGVNLRRNWTGFGSDTSTGQNGRNRGTGPREHSREDPPHGQLAQGPAAHVRPAQRLGPLRPAAHRLAGRVLR